VPIDWARPSTGTIEVAVARRHATDPAHRTGTLMLMPGGPGGSGVNDVLEEELPPELTARFDVVSFDPRGTNRSHPVMCDGDLAANPVETVPEAGATLASVNAYSKRLGDSCRELTGPLIDHVDNVSTARDIDAIRAALGERQLSLYGISYGTLTGQMYAETFPRRVRALVLDSVFDHSLSPRRFAESEAATGEDAFAEFAEWCATDTSCVLHGQDVGALFDAVYAKSVAGQLHTPDDPTRPLGPMALVSRMLSPLYGPAWTVEADQLKALSEQQPVAATRQAAEPAPFPMGSFCADFRVDISSEREWLSMWRQQKKAAPTLRTHFAWQAISMCDAWPARTGNPQHRLDVDGAPPILLMNSLHDPATAYGWATNVTDQIDGGVLLTYDGWGHGVFYRGECMLGATERYLLDLTVPAPGTHCAAVPPTTVASATVATTGPARW
jgi:pimeloyl-ACP methyl ester carboxylesterase